MNFCKCLTKIEGPGLAWTLVLSGSDSVAQSTRRGHRNPLSYCDLGHQLVRDGFAGRPGQIWPRAHAFVEQSIEDIQVAYY